jgi:hypothetical protein
MIKKQRVEKAIEIINFAIENSISVKSASKKNGYAGTYVKNVKANLKEDYENGIADENLYTHFNDTYGLYESNKKNKPPKVITGVIKTENTTENKPTTTKKGDKTTFRDKGDTAEIESKQTVDVRGIKHVKTVDELVEICDLDTDIWDIKDGTINKWDVTAWNRKTGKDEYAQNIQVKARFEKKKEFFRYKEAAKLFQRMVDGYEPPKLNALPLVHNKIPKNYEFLNEEKNLLEICIFDLHIGKLAWHGETGEDYDVKIATRRFIDALELLLYRASSFKYDKILFPIGNDFFNSDNLLNTTTKGTQQDEDLRWQKTFEVGCRLIVDGISLLRQIGVPVEVLVIPGNHDFERSFYLGSYLQAWFKNDEIVNINNSASPRKYFVFGEVLLGFSHGGEEKEGALPLIMASDKDSKQYWSNTKYHEWHLGHIHRKKQVNYVTLDKGTSLTEDLGVTVRYLSSLTGTEEWHHKKGFIGNIKAADAFIWNDKNGLISHLNANIIE